MLRFSSQVPWEGAIKVEYHEYSMLTSELLWDWNLIWKSQTLFQLPYLAETFTANVARWRLYLFIGKNFQNSTLEYSTSGQGPLCQITQYMYAVSEVRTQCPPGAIYSLRPCNSDILKFHSYHRGQTRALTVYGTPQKDDNNAWPLQVQETFPSEL